MILLELNGIYRHLYLYDDKIVIKRKVILIKLIQYFFNIDKSIYLTKISRIKVKEGTTLINGYFNLL